MIRNFWNNKGFSVCLGFANDAFESKILVFAARKCRDGKIVRSNQWYRFDSNTVRCYCLVALSNSL